MSASEYVSQGIVYIMVFFMALGALDRIIGNKFGLGQQFEEGFNAMGALSLGMIGVNCLAPMLGEVITPTIGPFFTVFGADPAMAGTIILSIDTGGYALAHAMTDNREIANLSAIILGSMMGPTLAFGVPVALSIINKKDTRFLALGTLAGVVVIPFACFIGGVLAGFDTVMVFKNLIPIFIVAVLIAAGLAFIPDQMIKGFAIFAKIIVAIITTALALAIISEQTGLRTAEVTNPTSLWGYFLRFLQGMAPLSDSYIIIGLIAIMLAGAYPLVMVITKLFKDPLIKVGGLLGINENSVAGLIATCANSIPMFNMVKDMDNKGKVINFSFACCAAFALGDHLGFCAGVEKEMIAPMVFSKLIGGGICIVAAIILCKFQAKRIAEDPAEAAA